MERGPDWIVRRDFPPSRDGYDRAAVDAHLEAVAAAFPRGEDGLPPAPADRELLAAGRVLLAQISSLRVELKHVSASLREQGVTISDVLDELLDLDDGPAPPSSADMPAPPEPPPLAPPTPPVTEPLPAQPAPEPLPAQPAPEPPPAQPAPEPPPALPLAGAASGPPPGPPSPGEALEPPAEPAPTSAATLEDARLVALDMALGGSSREEIDRELAARFVLPDRRVLVDEVLAAIG